jgi:formate hydrogenlyase subunit 3/multisubunit Na+/H+ antiporter MnhD subunit
MSGVMLEVALYGMIRVSFDLLGLPLWWWGLLPLALGLFSALYGVVFAAVQTDMKRLLAYSSIENIGIMFTGLGLAIVFAGVGMRSIAALTLIAVMYHAMNHAVMKSLLFLGTGAVLHATGERNLGHLGGLIHRMPWVAWLTLIGVLAIAGLPPLNGFVSEWLLLQSFLLAYQVPHPFINMLLPLGAALLALAAALAAYVMVKFYGVIFLGQPREQTLQEDLDAGFAERLGLVLLASGCILLGFFPSFVISSLSVVTLELGLGGLPVNHAPWWLLLPIPERQSSYAPLVFFAVILAVVVLSIFSVRLFYHQRVRRSAAWDCGFGRATSRMQDTAEGFGQPIRHLFQPLFTVVRQLPRPFDTAPTYRLEIGDRIWLALYEPLGPLVRRVADKVAWLQQGRIATYLLYSFVTLVVLLALML